MLEDLFAKYVINLENVKIFKIIFQKCNNVKDLNFFFVLQNCRKMPKYRIFGLVCTKFIKNKKFGDLFA